MSVITTFQPINLSYDFTRDEFERLMFDLATAEVSDITIITGRPVMIKLHGHQMPATKRHLGDHEVRKILAWMYGDNAIAEISRSHALDKRYEIDLGDGKRAAFRMNAVGCLAQRGTGQHITLRAMPRETPRLDGMEIPQEMVKEFIDGGTGLFVVVGATGSGKSTLLAAIMNFIMQNGENRKVVTFEAPIEFDLSSLKSERNMVIQSEIGVGANILNFSEGVRAALRQGPTDIEIGEARDKETIEEMMHAAETGHATYCTVHAESVRTTLVRIAQPFPTDAFDQIIFTLLSLARVIVCQRLAMPAERARKRVPIREWLVFDPDLRKRLLRMTARDALNEIEAEVERRGQSFAQQAWKAYHAGLITANTLARFVGDAAVGLPDVAPAKEAA